MLISLPPKFPSCETYFLSQLTGDYIGTFGQPAAWELSTPTTFSPTKPPEIAQFELDTADMLASQNPTSSSDKILEPSEDDKLGGGREDRIASAAAVSVATPAGRRVSGNPQKLKRHDDTAPRPPTSTTDVSSPTYHTWYANSLFATSRFAHRRRPRTLPPMNLGRAYNNAGGGVQAIFHCLPLSPPVDEIGVRQIRGLRLGGEGGGGTIPRAEIGDAPVSGKTGGKR